MPRSNHLGDLEELVLLSALRLGPDAHGGAVRTDLKERADRSVSVSTVYVTLMRLEEKGYVRSRMGESSGARGGKARRLFEATPEGVEALETVRAVRRRMWAAVEGESHAG